MKYYLQCNFPKQCNGGILSILPSKPHWKDWPFFQRIAWHSFGDALSVPSLSLFTNVAALDLLNGSEGSFNCVAASNFAGSN